MKRFNEFIKELSLTQQLFALIFFFVTFFAAFFFVYLSNNVDRVIADQMTATLRDSQAQVAHMMNAGLDETYLEKLTEKSDIKNIWIKSNLVAYPMNTDELDNDSLLWQKMQEDVKKLYKDPTIGSIENHYTLDDTSYYYRIMTLNNGQLLLSYTNSAFLTDLKETIVNSIIYITVIVVGFFFVILMIWVAGLIHPLNQIRNYIERIKLGKDATLKINRKDEIGELADAIVSMRNELLRQEKTKEEMIHNISHDLKTPIATIKSYGESIKDGIYPYETLEKSVDVIIDNADRLETKVHSLLFMNRVEYLISQDTEGLKTDMKYVVEMVLRNTKVIKPDIVVETQLEEVFFDGIEETWRVTVENIIENAYRYANSKIVIHLSEEEGLTIENDGPCIDEDRLDVLFKPYEKGKGGKFGLGLSIVAKVVSANHYKVCGENTSDGVIFRIYR